MPAMLTATILSDAEPVLAEIGEEPFLTAMAANELPDEALARWIREDTHFLRTLRRMVASLIVGAPDERAVDVISGAYPALQFELDRFAREAERLGEDLDGPPAAVTTRFDDLLWSAARAGFAEGIGVYWAVEVAYLEAWSAVRRRVGLQEPYAVWIENWTSDAFRDFVDALGVIVDEYGSPDVVRRRAAEVFELERELWRWCFEGDSGAEQRPLG
jgi:thiaminase/transcriptional activator TenA